MKLTTLFLSAATLFASPVFAGETKYLTRGATLAEMTEHCSKGEYFGITAAEELPVEKLDLLSCQDQTVDRVSCERVGYFAATLPGIFLRFEKESNPEIYKKFEQYEQDLGNGFVAKCGMS